MCRARLCVCSPSRPPPLSLFRVIIGHPFPVNLRRHAETPPNTARRTLYRNYIGAVHGYLGRGNRVAVPVCVRNLIREMFPDPAGGYMGHMVAEGIEEFDG